jgi:hypothetical protein
VYCKEEEEEEAPLSEMKENVIVEESSIYTVISLYFFVRNEKVTFLSLLSIPRELFRFVPKQRRIVHKVSFVRPPTLERGLFGSKEKRTSTSKKSF